MSNVVELHNVTVELTGIRVLDGVDLHIESGEIVGVAGPNGSGKTTLARTVATLQPVSSGAIVHFEGAGPSTARSSIGLLGHQPYLIPQLTLAENLAHIGRLGGYESDRLSHAIDVVGLADAADRRASESSFGMLRRIEIAQQLVAKPGLLLLDEATSGLDSSAIDLVASLITLTAQRRGGVLIVSHDSSYLDTKCDRVLELANGKLRQRK